MGEYKTYSDSAWGDLLTNYDGTAINYDAIGNPTNWRNASSLTWEGRELSGLTLSNEDSFTYTYNSDGIRTQKKYYDYDYCGYYTYDYVLDGTRIISETAHRDSTKLYTLYYLYDESGSVVGFIYNNAYYYFQKNLQGDIVRILDYTGNIVTEYTYDAWGKVLSVTGSHASTIGKYNPFRYRSYYYDVETGFYYLQSRYYDPIVGRFLNADVATMIGANGTVVGHNLFAYSNNNPIMFTDHTGYDAIVLAKTEGPLQHMGALVQDENSNWWHFYWGADGFWWSIISSSGIPVPAKIWCQPYEGELNLDAINASKQYESYDKMVYLTGDFSKCVNAFKNVNGTYNLYNRNCMHATLTILSKADTSYSNTLKEALNCFTISEATECIEQSVGFSNLFAQVLWTALKINEAVFSNKTENSRTKSRENNKYTIDMLY